MAAIFMMIGAVLMVVGARLVSTARQQSVQTNLYVAEAENVARAGLMDSLGYLRRNSGINPLSAYTTIVPVNATPTFTINSQTGTTFTYPDQAFQPQLNTTTAQISDTIEPLIGLVNEFSVDSANNSLDANAVYFGRYEVNRQPNPFPTPASTPYTPVPNAVHDVSGNRLMSKLNGDGLVWTVTSTGYVYKRVDKSFANGTPTPGTTYFSGQWRVPYNQAPNTIIAKAKLSTEFRKFQFILPPGGQCGVTGQINAAVYCDKASHVNINSTQGQLSGSVSATGTFGIAAVTGTCPSSPSGIKTAPSFTGGVTCVAGGCMAMLADANIFAMSVSEVRFVADRAGDATNPLDLSNSHWGLYYYGGSVTWGYTQPAPYTTLNSTGILVVNGNLTFTGGNGNGLIQFAGIIYCTGNVTITNGTEVDGCVILGTPYFNGGGSTPSTLTLDGNGSNYGILNLNPQLVNQALKLVATYREDVSERRVLLSIPNY